jgi:hypothetical protein
MTRRSRCGRPRLTDPTTSIMIAVPASIMAAYCDELDRMERSTGVRVTIQRLMMRDVARIVKAAA